MAFSLTAAQRIASAAPTKTRSSAKAATTMPVGTVCQAESGPPLRRPSILATMPQRMAKKKERPVQINIARELVMFVAIARPNVTTPRTKLAHRLTASRRDEDMAVFLQQALPREV